MKENSQKLILEKKLRSSKSSTLSFKKILKIQFPFGKYFPPFVKQPKRVKKRQKVNLKKKWC